MTVASRSNVSPAITAPGSLATIEPRRLPGTYTTVDDFATVRPKRRSPSDIAIWYAPGLVGVVIRARIVFWAYRAMGFRFFAAGSPTGVETEAVIPSGAGLRGVPRAS